MVVFFGQSHLCLLPDLRYSPNGTNNLATIYLHKHKEKVATMLSHGIAAPGPGGSRQKKHHDTDAILKHIWTQVREQCVNWFLTEKQAIMRNLRLPKNSVVIVPCLFAGIVFCALLPFIAPLHNRATEFAFWESDLRLPGDTRRASEDFLQSLELLYDSMPPGTVRTVVHAYPRQMQVSFDSVTLVTQISLDKFPQLVRLRQRWCVVLLLTPRWICFSVAHLTLSHALSVVSFFPEGTGQLAAPCT